MSGSGRRRTEICPHRGVTVVGARKFLIATTWKPQHFYDRILRARETKMAKASGFRRAYLRYVKSMGVN